MTQPQVLRGWIYLILQQLFLADTLHLCNFLLGSPLGTTSLNFVFWSLNFLITTILFRGMLIADGKKALSRPKNTIVYTLVGLLGYFALTRMITIAIFRMDSSFFNVNDSAIVAMATEHYVLVFLGTVILVPVAEESLFRGVIFQSLYNRSRLLAYGISCILFAVPHIVGYIGSYSPLHLLLCFIQYIPAGICLGWSYAKSDTIICPILMHTVINLIGFLNLG